MISVVIPTMWYSKCIEYQISLLNCHPLVSEIILFNNRPEAQVPFVLQFSKVREQNTGENMFVGPCWNVGVRLSENDKVVIINDDVIFNTSLIDYLDEQITEDVGMLCIEPGNVSLVIDGGGIDLEDSRNEPKIRNHLQKISEKIKPSDHSMTKVDKLKYKSAIVFGIHKRNYVDIPEEFKIYYTDMWVFKTCQKNNKFNYFIKGADLKSAMSRTVNHFRSQTKQESSVSGEVFKRHGMKPLW